MGRLLFLADIHLGSERIIRLCHRPFKSIDEQDEIISSNWKRAVKEDDTVYLLGDLAEGDWKRVIRILSDLPGRKVLVFGNHDDEESLAQYKKAGTFEAIIPYGKVEQDQNEIILFHYPIMDWENRQFGSILIYGHIHNKDLPEIKDYYKNKPCYNCGADVIGFTPRTLEELRTIKEAQQ